MPARSRKKSIRKKWSLPLGAALLKSGSVFFRVWAPRAREISMRFPDAPGLPARRLEPEGGGYFSAAVEGAGKGTKYLYTFDGKERPDPVSRSQPGGVHEASEVIDPDAFRWTDQGWKGRALKDFIFYELHIGTFTPEGTFEAAIAKIPYLKDLGITCVEVMPVAQFPGRRNWGYDGVGFFAPQSSYGGPEGFRKFVDACHQSGLAVCLDVVYNHLGPEGNYLHDYGPYFTDRHRTPWGDAVNYDGQGSAGVREWVIQNALYWVHEFHIDALRLDAIHGIFDDSPKHILRELKETVAQHAKKIGRPVFLIAESDLNDPKVIRPPRSGGYGLDAQWSDDFHHAVHRELTGETRGYYQDYRGVRDIVRAVRDHFVYTGQYSKFRGRKYGAPAKGFPPERFVIHIQNHDQVGNRAFGDRLSTLVSFEQQKLAAALLLLSPQLPLLWMGQEYGEEAPFQYFIDHQDEGLVQAVRDGRKHEFASFGWKHLPDPKAEETFLKSKLNWKAADRGNHARLLKLYRELIRLRKVLGLPAKPHRMAAGAKSPWFALVYAPRRGPKAAAVFSFSGKTQKLSLPFSGRSFEVRLDTAAEVFGGPARDKEKKTPGRSLKDLEMSPQSALIGYLR